MTVVVSCNLPDGVILGVDSAVTLPALDGSVAKVYEKGEKLFPLGDCSIGVVTYGIGALGPRSIGSYLQEFEDKNPGNVLDSCKIADVVEALRVFFMSVYTDNIIKPLETAGTKFETIPKEKRLFFGLIVGGFSSGDYLSEIYEIQIPHHETKESVTQVRKQGIFGVNWFAWGQPITRYLNGIDFKLFDELISYFVAKRGGTALSQTELQEVLAIANKYAYQIPYNGMSLEEGISHVKFLVELAINHYHYASGDPIIGGNPIVGGSVKIGKVSYREGKFEIQPDI